MLIVFDLFNTSSTQSLWYTVPFCELSVYWLHAITACLCVRQSLWPERMPPFPVACFQSLYALLVNCAILGFWECATQSRDCANSQIARNIHIPQRTCNDQVSQGYTVWSRRCQTQHQVIRSGMEQNRHTYTISGVRTVAAVVGKLIFITCYRVINS